jgi:hypothetical protein
MAAQEAFFATDTAVLRQPRDFKVEPTRVSDIRAPARLHAPRKTLAERLIEAWLAPWTHGFTPLW